ncbi:MAG: Ig-like domain-containing protein [Beduini sp.]|uniref:Ig-like domain-containing protein n=1 Tax=Beduini sp. TaxID=1922300 RepID=UPI003990480E
MKKTISLFVSVLMIGSLIMGNLVSVNAVGENEINDTENVAEIGETKYTSLSDAVQNVAEGQTIKLLNDINLESTIDVNGKSFVLELNGKKVTQSLTGESVNKTAAPIRLFDSSLIVNDSVGGGSIFGYQCAVGVFVNSKLTLNSGTLKGEWYGVAGNGLNNNGTTITINGGSVLNSDPDGTGAAIYHPQTGEITINGGTVKGDLGIQLCAGNLSVVSINGGMIEGTGEDHRVDKTGDGAVPDGAAISIVNRPGYSSVPNVTISGGTFKSVYSEGLLAYTWSKNTASEWTDAKDHIQVIGGTFDSDPTDYVKAGYKAYPIEDTFKVAPIATGIELSDTTLTLEAGSNKTLTATVNPNETLDTVTWESSDPKIAVVENGVVKAVAPGKATITATAGNAKAECVVSVYKVENPTPPSVDTQKPVEKPQAGLNDEKAPEILNDTLNDIISKGTDSVYTDEKTVQNINDAIASGETITVNPTVEEINTANPQASEDIKAIEKELKQITQENNSVTEVAMYLDLSVLVKTPTSDLGNITVLPKPLTFTVVLPNAVAENAKDKDVYVLRMHEGKVDKIKAALTDNVITFETDRFSTYAVVFEEKTVTPAPTPEGPIHEVTFVDMNGAVLKIESVKDGEKATAPAAPTIEGYTFIKWDTDFSKVTKDLVVTAVYEKLPVEEVVKPDDKGENKTENTDNPSTGDKTNASLYSAFALLGLVSAALVAVEKKRRSLSR